MSGKARACLRCRIRASIVEKRFDVYLYTVPERYELQNSGDRGESEKRSPVILESFRVIYVACVPKSIRGPSKRKGDCNEQAR